MKKNLATEKEYADELEVVAEPTLSIAEGYQEAYLAADIPFIHAHGDRGNYQCHNLRDKGNEQRPDWRLLPCEPVAIPGNFNA